MPDRHLTPPHHAVATSSIIIVSDKAGHRDPLVHIRSASPAESALLAAQALKTSSNIRSSTQDPFDLAGSPSTESNDNNSPPVAYSDRWSQSTTGSSAPNAARIRSDERRMATTAQITPESSSKPWMKRTNSPAGSPSIAHSNRYSPTQGFRPPSANSKLDEYRPGRTGSGSSATSRTRSPRPASPRLERAGAPKLRLPLGDVNNRPHQSSPLSSPAPRLLTPHAPYGQGPGGTPLSQVEGADYFGLGIAVSRDQASQKSRPGSPGISTTSYASSSRRHRDRDSDVPGSPTSSRPRTKERREKDKKAMLSKALEKANAAVLLDNALNYQGALDSYVDACRLLLNVMERTTSDEDRRKLNAIRITYTTRIDELRELLGPTASVPQETAQSSSSTPPRSSQGPDLALQLGPVTSPSPPPPEQITVHTGALHSSSSQPRKINASRDSFLTDAIREVEGSRASGFLGPLWERSKNPMANGFFGDSTSLTQAELSNAAAPSPLAPARSISPAANKADHEREAPKAGAEDVNTTPKSGAEAMSWLNTIEESESDDASALPRSKRNGKAVRRDTEVSGNGNSEFDAAFDAAVEAAYDDGSELDHSHEQEYLLSPVAYGMPTHTAERPGHARTESETQGHGVGHGFDFHLNSSAPSQSASVDTTQVPNQSAVNGQPESNANANPFSFFQDSPRHVRKKSNTLSSADLPSNISPSRLQPANMEVRPLSSGANEGNGAHQNLAIQTSLSPKRNRATSRTSEITPGTSAPSVEDVAPWTLQSQPGDFKSVRQGATRQSNELEQASRHPSSAMSESTASPTSAFSTQSPQYASFRKESSLFPPPEELPVLSPNSVFTSPGGRRYDSGPPIGQRVNTASSGHSTAAMVDGGGAHLFDASLGTRNDPSINIPQALEPCPDSTLLRPFWLMRTIESAIVNPRGGYMTNRLFLPREAWLNKTIKLKNVEDKVASCDTLTTSLAKLNTVNTLDAEAVLQELQVFEDIMEKVQATLSKKLGNEVGVSGVTTLFKDAGQSAESPPDGTTRDSMKMHSGKSYLTGWRKLRGKTLSGGGTGASNVSINGARTADASTHTMATVPMTSSGPSEKQNAQRRDALRDAIYEGPLRDYMSSIARLCDAAQALDQIARQVEDPGLKHSSPTHVGLELSMRHTAEFFGLWICRFILADIGLLVDKYVKRSTEWLLL